MRRDAPICRDFPEAARLDAVRELAAEVLSVVLWEATKNPPFAGISSEKAL
jgi:hypothetical protein